MCGRCKKQADGFMDSVEELCEEVEMVRGFCYLGDRVSASGGCETAVRGSSLYHTGTTAQQLRTLLIYSVAKSVQNSFRAPGCGSVVHSGSSPSVNGHTGNPLESFT